MEIAKKHQDSLQRIKENVTNAHDYFDDNYKRWHAWQRFIGVSSMETDDLEILKTLGKPQIQFNILEAFISRLLGEFSKQQPSVAIAAATGKEVPPQLLEILEGYIRHIEYESKAKGTANQIYSDLLKGGFSVAKVTADYKNNNTFEQEVKLTRVYDPTLCFFDPLARLPDKSDGRYLGELFPKTKAEFENEYPNVDMSKVTFARSMEGFSWSYSTNTEDILFICDYYEKKLSRKRIVELSNGETIDAKDYDKLIDDWNTNEQLMQVPVIVKERMVNVEKIVRYRFIESEILEYVEMDTRPFPLVFFDGNSVTYRETDNGEMQQFTRPYPYHAKGVQQLKNFTGQALANEIENISQSKIMMPDGGIPDNYADAYTKPQLPTVMMYSPFLNGDPTKPLPPPQAVPRTAIEPVIINTFAMADKMTQTILGSYDASLGINDNQLSGIAIVEGATQSNSAAMPYIVSYLQGFNQVARVMLDLVSNLQLRNIPVRTADGKAQTVPLDNKPLDFDIDDLNVEVTAGLNFEVQKSKANQVLMGMLQAFGPQSKFTQFMQTDGMSTVLDNLEIKGADQLKDKYQQWEQKMQQQQMQQQQMQQQQMQNDPKILKAKNDSAKIQQDGQQNEIENQLKLAELKLDKQKLDNEKMEIAEKINDNNAKRHMQVMRDQTTKDGQAVELAIKAVDISHKHHKEAIETLTKVKE